MNEVSAFAPGNVSCVFKIVPHPDPERMHSLGLGFTVEDGVTVTVRRSDGETTVSLNGMNVEFKTVRSVMSTLTDEPLVVSIETGLPISSGFGISGASALATAHAVNAICDLRKSPDQIAMTAHVAEVRNLTGLGDVCGQNLGGCLVKLVEGSPLAAERLDIDEREIFYRYFSPIHTSEIIGDPERRERINLAADAALSEIAESHLNGTVEFEQCVEVARRFSEDSGLLQDPQVRAVIDGQLSAGHHASMIMLGNAVFSTHPFEGCRRTLLAKRPAGLVA